MPFAGGAHWAGFPCVRGNLRAGGGGRGWQGSIADCPAPS